MTAHHSRPLLFLDVDGPLLPFGDIPISDPLLPSPSTRLDPLIGAGLAALPCDLVWATAWEDDANTEVAPLLGLPELPVVHWPASSDEREQEDRWFGLHWKTRTLVSWAAGRPFIWVDDELTGADRAWVSAQHPAPALLHHVPSFRGLTPADLTALRHWLHSP